MRGPDGFIPRFRKCLLFARVESQALFDDTIVIVAGYSPGDDPGYHRRRQFGQIG